MSYIRRVFGLDYRSLALLRIFVGLTLLLDLIQRSRSLLAHYTDFGVLPRSELFRLGSETAFWSVHTINGTPLYVAILFMLAGASAVMMIVGYRTRIATIASFVLLVSLHNRNPFILQGGDVAFRVILFWMMFLPLAKRFSMDVLLGTEEYPKEKTYYALPGVLYLLQFLIIYFFTGFLKDGVPWIGDFSAVSLALSLDEFTTHFGMWLKSLPDILPYLTMITIAIERFVFVSFFSPIKTQWVRLIGIVLVNCLIISFNLSMRLGLFGMIMVSISLGLLPSVFWDRIVTPLRLCFARKSKPGWTIFYDIDCGFCEKITHGIQRFFLMHPSTVIVPAAGNPEVATLMDQKNSWVIQDSRGNRYTGFRGFISVLDSACFFRLMSPVLRLKPLSFLGEKIYRFVSHNRPITCNPVFEDTAVHVAPSRTVLKGALVIVFAGVLLWNIRTLPRFSGLFIPHSLEKVLLILRLDQKWNMFAPYPTTEDGFYVIPGTLRDGTEVNVYTGGSVVSYEKPDDMAWMYQNQRWQKYLMNLWLKDYSEYRLGYGRYLCKRWNKYNVYDKQLMTFSIVYVLEKTDLTTLQEGPLEPVTIWEHNCFK